MDNWLQKALHKANDHSTLHEIRRVYGGSINKTFFVETETGQYFIKHHMNAPERFFVSEAEGLELIRQTNTVAVPEVYAVSDAKNAAFLVMEWVEGRKMADTEKKLGERIAGLHKHIGNKHGFFEASFIGALPQPNGLFSSWLEYYRDRRLGAQLQQGIDRHRITGKRRRQMETLLVRLGEWIPEKVEPSCLHGDLWGGNWLVGPGGEPYVIDPSVLYGDRHFELAFTELFGGFSQTFYDAYKERFPLDDNYADMKPLYQLYYLLVHLNLFGESYGAHVDAILKRYVGEG
ncbi:MAG TPA: fructosamine kinase family protein [Bacillota bacterium]|nr:fructosamine kinase family protein [Bacillota bacterium]